MRGDGRIFKNGTYFWCCYYVDGAQHRENTKCTDEDGANKYLRSVIKLKHAHEIGAQDFVTPQNRKLKVNYLLNQLKAHYERNGKASTQTLSHLRTAARHFGEKYAVKLTPEMVTEYQKTQRQAGYAPASINRPLQVLRAAFHFAAKHKRITSVPFIEMLSEQGNERKGFFTEAEFRELVSHLPEDGLADFARFSFATGMRRGEAASLTWGMVSGDELRIPGEVTKNRKPRVLPISGEVADIFERREAARRIEQDGTLRIAEYIFHRGDGEPMGEFKKTWARACVAAKQGAMICPKCKAEGTALTCEPCDVATQYRGRIWHDFRRSSIRQRIKAGVSVQEAKLWSGHKSDSIFFRYSILTGDDMKISQEKTEQYRKDELARTSKVRAMR